MMMAMMMIIIIIIKQWFTERDRSHIDRAQRWGGGGGGIRQMGLRGVHNWIKGKINIHLIDFHVLTFIKKTDLF